MSPASEALSGDVALLEEAVAEAAALVMTFAGADPKTWKKRDVSPVTEADIAADRCLHEALIGGRPDYGWLSEETEDDPARLDRRRVWIVDPIDGTNAFLQGKPDFTICAALAEQGRVIAAAVTNPTTEQRFTATLGGGAFLNGMPLGPANDPSLDKARILARRNLFKPERWRGEPPDVKHGYIGSIAYQLCLVAAGKWDAALAVNPLHEWDIAAAALILNEAGGVVTDQTRAGLWFNRADPVVNGMICAPPRLHDDLAARLVPKTPA